jgi:hypothetical protein
MNGGKGGRDGNTGLPRISADEKDANEVSSFEAVASKEQAPALGLQAPPPVVVADALHAEDVALRLRGELERGVRERSTQLEAAHHELDVLSYAVSHDLRAPLRRIDAASMALLADHADSLDSDGRERLRRVQVAAHRMGRLVDGFLEIAQFGHRELRRQSVDLSFIARAVAADLRDGDPSRDVQFSIADELHADCDPGLGRIVLENLLQNAWKFSAAQPRARIELSWSMDHAAFVVGDNGIGFDMRDASQLFIPFGRLHPDGAFEGLGIGLATVKRIILRHGGRVWAESAPGRGVRVWFTWR